MIIPTNTALDEKLLVGFDGNPLGGLKTGWAVQVRGKPQAGTSTFCWNLVHSLAQLDGDTHAVWLDLDGSATPELLRHVEDDLDIIIMNTREAKVVTDYMDAIANHVNLIILDKVDAFTTSGWNYLAYHCARIASEYNVLVVAVSGEWYSPTNRVAFTAGEDLVRLYFTLGLSIDKGTAETVYSKVTIYPKRIRYEYGSELRGVLPGPYRLPQRSV